jgi:hypothetical protein
MFVTCARLMPIKRGASTWLVTLCSAAILRLIRERSRILRTSMAAGGAWLPRCAAIHASRRGRPGVSDVIRGTSTPRGGARPL